MWPKYFFCDRSSILPYQTPESVRALARIVVELPLSKSQCVLFLYRGSCGRLGARQTAWLNRRGITRERLTDETAAQPLARDTSPMNWRNTHVKNISNKNVHSTARARSCCRTWDELTVRQVFCPDHTALHMAERADRWRRLCAGDHLQSDRTRSGLCAHGHWRRISPGPCNQAVGSADRWDRLGRLELDGDHQPGHGSGES